nr:immunoglobulin light chain junction region [Macaca mulatta]MPO08270.1 immunoglobulin light chain junction region [Macaca mulatta]MPO08664.1 immunoglobulin light chain junction region [Macaca mulatta]MPO09835.1 immunoglobulin light chain junction region [Macaca mulatta]MPO11321.1 immunoglobulin light chain junction region [Macaca mulatta]
CAAWDGRLSGYIF